jgi:hypothetical protein
MLILTCLCKTELRIECPAPVWAKGAAWDGADAVAMDMAAAEVGKWDGDADPDESMRAFICE